MGKDWGLSVQWGEPAARTTSRFFDDATIKKFERCARSAPVGVRCAALRCEVRALSALPRRVLRGCAGASTTTFC